MTPPAEPSKRRQYQIGGTQRTRECGASCAVSAMDDACSQDFYAKTAGGLQCARSFRYLRLTRAHSVCAVKLRPHLRQFHERCDVVVPDLTDFVEFGRLSPWSECEVPAS